MDHSASWSVKTLLSLVLDVARKVMALPPSISRAHTTVALLFFTADGDNSKENIFGSMQQFCFSLVFPLRKNRE
jgi:hypothetical protein